MDGTTVDSLVERVRRLERERRVWRVVGSSILVGALACAVAGADPVERPKVVEGERFVLKDRTGRQRGMLGVGPNGLPCLILVDRRGSQRLVIGLEKEPADSPTVSLFDQNEVERAALHVMPNGAPVLTFLGENGKARVVLSTTPDGSPGLDLRNADGKVQVGITATPDGSAGLSLYDKDQEADVHPGRLNVGISPNGSPTVKLLRKDGTPLSVLPSS